MQQASKLNFVSQPAISQGIKKLEEQLEIKLFHHKQREIQLTAEGKSLATKCEQVFSSINILEEHVEQLKGNISGLLSLGSSQSIASHFISPLISKYTKQYPLVDISMSFGKTNSLKQLIIDKKIEFALAIDNGELGSVNKEVIYNGNFVLFGKKQSNTYLVTEGRPETILLRKALSNENDIRFLELESWTVIKDFVNSGHGIGLIPDYMMGSKDKKNIIDIDNFSATYKTVIIYSKNNLSTAAKKFISLLKS